MKIESIEISYLYSGGMNNEAEGLTHNKVLPSLSIVQSVHGSYEVAVEDAGSGCTGEMGVFVAPSGKRQTITHHNGKGGYMVANWVFMDVTVNNFYRIDDLFSFPLIMDAKYNQRIFELIDEISNYKNVCRRYAAAYSLLEILLDNAAVNNGPDWTKMRIQKFVTDMYRERIAAEDIAKYLHCSVSQVFRFTHKYFGQSPANYINSIRMQNAAKLLEITSIQIKEVALSSGFDDTAYFSKLFKKTFSVSPSEYRRRYIVNPSK